jgi:hypothetical protein
MNYEKVTQTDEEGSGDHDHIPVQDVELVELINDIEHDTVIQELSEISKGFQDEISHIY